MSWKNQPLSRYRLGELHHGISIITALDPLGPLYVYHMEERELGTITVSDINSTLCDTRFLLRKLFICEYCYQRNTVGTYDTSVHTRAIQRKGH